MRLAGKVAIVTGGGSGFGEGIARRFAEEGAKLVVNDIDDAGGARVAAAIDKAHGQGSAIYVHADVSDNAAMGTLVKRALERFDRIDIMVNNAGTTHVNGSMLDVPEEIFDRVFAVNVKSIYLSALHVVPVMRRQGRGGVILNTASTAGIRARGGLTWYCGSKGAAITLSKAMAQELARDQIRVNALPGRWRNAALAALHGRRHARAARKVPGDDPLGPLRHAARRGQRRALSRLR